MQRLIFGIFLAAALYAVSSSDSYAGAASNPCARPNAGAVVTRPPDLYSQHGVLRVTFNYLTALDSFGRTLFCFETPDGMQSPTLHVRPGDTLDITVTNQVPRLPPGSPT